MGKRRKQPGNLLCRLGIHVWDWYMPNPYSYIRRCTECGRLYRQQAGRRRKEHHAATKDPSC